MEILSLHLAFRPNVHAKPSKNKSILLHDFLLPMAHITSKAKIIISSLLFLTLFVFFITPTCSNLKSLIHYLFFRVEKMCFVIFLSIKINQIMMGMVDKLCPYIMRILARFFLGERKLWMTFASESHHSNRFRSSAPRIRHQTILFHRIYHDRVCVWLILLRNTT